MKKYFKGLSASTVLLTFASFFSDVGTEMLYPVLPIFLTDVLKSPASVVGIVEGIATAAQYIIQGVSGWISDRFKKRKLIAVSGTLIATIAKFSIGLSTNWVQVTTSRSIERLSTGIRAAPRDALVADSATDESRGKAFGLEGIGDNLGAFVGPLIAIGLLFFLHVPIRWIFFLAFIPGVLAVFMISLVKEKHHNNVIARSETTKQSQTNEIATPHSVGLAMTMRSFPKTYWKYLLVTAIFGLGNSSNAFLILRTKQIGISLETTILIYAFFNLIAALSSYPAGFLSDKMGRKNVLLVSFFIFVAVYLGFAFGTNFLLIGFLFILYGVFGGIFRAVGKAFATDFVSSNIRASAVGLYATTIGLSGLVASFAAGFLWTNINPQAAFLYGVVFAILGSISLMVLIKKN